MPAVLGRPLRLAVSTLAQRTPLAPYPPAVSTCTPCRPHLPRVIEIFLCAVRVEQIRLNRQTHFT
jgi:hypothetical protein